MNLWHYKSVNVCTTINHPSRQWRYEEYLRVWVVWWLESQMSSSWDHVLSPWFSASRVLLRKLGIWDLTDKVELCFWEHIFQSFLTPLPLSSCWLHGQHHFTSLCHRLLGHEFIWKPTMPSPMMALGEILWNQEPTSIIPPLRHFCQISHSNTKVTQTWMDLIICTLLPDIHWALV